MSDSRRDSSAHEATSPPNKTPLLLAHDHTEFNVIFVHSRLDDYGLSAAVFRVYCHLARRAGKGAAYPSVSTIATVCRLHPDTVRAALRTLTVHRLLTRQDRPGETSLYRLTPASHWEPPMSINSNPSEANSPPSLSVATLGERREAHPSETNPAKGNSVEGKPKKGIHASMSPLQGEAEAVMSLWNSFSELPRLQQITNRRMKTLHERLADEFFRANWRVGIERMAKSPFCTGHGPRGWKANLDWFLRSETLTKLLEGQYDFTVGPTNRNPQPKVIRAEDHGCGVSKL